LSAPSEQVSFSQRSSGVLAALLGSAPANCSNRSEKPSLSVSGLSRSKKPKRSQPSSASSIAPSPSLSAPSEQAFFSQRSSGVLAALLGSERNIWR
jgi:hypothetical protein